MQRKSLPGNWLILIFPFLRGFIWSSTKWSITIGLFSSSVFNQQATGLYAAQLLAAKWSEIDFIPT